MNYIWTGMIILGILFGMMTGHMSEINSQIMDSAKEAVVLCINMSGIIMMWSGIMEIAQNAGIIAFLTKHLKPVLIFLFPDLPEKHPAEEYILLNFVANILGLGWAATPAGLQAMKELQKLNEERRIESQIASNEMCTFLVLNISSLQIIPINIIAYRKQYGSSRPTSILFPAFIATLVSTIIAIIFCLINNRKEN